MHAYMYCSYTNFNNDFVIVNQCISYVSMGLLYVWYFLTAAPDDTEFKITLLL